MRAEALKLAKCLEDPFFISGRTDAECIRIIARALLAEAAENERLKAEKGRLNNSEKAKEWEESFHQAKALEKAAIEKWRRYKSERDELRAIIHDSAKFVIPGERDTSGAFVEMLRNAKAENEKLRTPVPCVHCGNDTQGAINCVLAKLEKARSVISACDELRIYCLGSDASTLNMISRFDLAREALKEIDEPTTPPPFQGGHKFGNPNE